VSAAEEIVQADKLSRANELFGQRKLEESWEMCLEYLADYPNDVQALRLKASLQSIRGDANEAIESINAVIRLSNGVEPCDFFDRGRWRLALGDVDAAIVDFEEILMLSDRYQDYYYAEGSHLHLAYIFAKHKQIAKAALHLRHLNSESVSYIDKTVVNAEYIRKLLLKEGP
jgi:tetratricopeptide (TPR) repeat protein